MSSNAPGIFRQAWLKWKALRLPWRRQFLIGSDLSGNTFWEFRDDIRAGRWRRIAKYPTGTHHADVKISPQWIQWLRHTRHQAPSIQEQQYEVSRQAMMKQLAAEADERWNSTPRYMDGPERQQALPATAINENEGPSKEQSDIGDAPGVSSLDAGEQEVSQTGEEQAKAKGKRQREENPWGRPQTGAPSENWQPGSWTPGVAQRR